MDLQRTPMGLLTKVTLKMINKTDKARTDGFRVMNTKGLSNKIKWKALENLNIPQDQLFQVNLNVTAI